MEVRYGISVPPRHIMGIYSDYHAALTFTLDSAGMPLLAY